MYIPKHFDQKEIDALHGLIRSFPLATLVTISSSGLEANHIPFLLSPHPSPLGTLTAHVARANPIWTQRTTENDAIVIFQNHNTYITPSWYPSKKETGKVVPTWNYAVAHAYGKIRFVDELNWLKSHIEEITNFNEASFPEPWQVSDAPNDYIEKSLSAIVGVEIIITKLIGKWKVSQNQSVQNRAGVIKGLRSQDTDSALAMANLIEVSNKD